MTFVIVAGGLLLLVLIILLVPLIRESNLPQADQRQQQNINIAREKKRQLEEQLADGEIDQAAYDAAYRELQSALALELGPGETVSEKTRGTWMALVVLVSIPVASVTLYALYGEYRVVENPALVQQGVPRQAGAAPQMSLDEMEAALKEKLKDNPEDAEGWFLFGRTLMAKQDYTSAVTAFRRSDELMPNEPGILFALADALAMRSNGSLQGEPEELVQRGLELAPRFPNGLWLAGMAAQQRSDFAAAHRYWTLLLPLIEDNPQSAEEVRSLLAMLEQRVPELASEATAAASAQRQLTLQVDISDELRARASPDSSVFVYAKAMQGPPMPLAVKRLRLADLPLTLTLDDGDAMMPSMKLSSFDRVVVGARVSASGNPIAQDGDFYTELGSVDSVNPPAQISLTIDRIKGAATGTADSSVTTTTVASAPPQLTLEVDISEELRGRAAPDSAVFVYAKAMQGPPMPLAVKRLRLADLPATLTLGDADAMMPTMKLSSFAQVAVGARVSMSGNPVAQSGDFYTERGSIDSGNPPPRIALTIDQIK